MAVKNKWLTPVLLFLALVLIVWAVDSTPPVVHLISPANNTYSNNPTQTFTCNATDETELKNIAISAWLNNTPILSTSCYQESANQTNQTGTDSLCTLKYSGVYWNISDSIYINYTKPTLSATSNSLWRYNVGGNNYTSPINSSCWDYSPTLLSLKIVGSSNQTNGNFFDGYCYNSTNWVHMWSKTGSWSDATVKGTELAYDGLWTTSVMFWSGGVPGNWAVGTTINGFYEEAMMWNLSSLITTYSAPTSDWCYQESTNVPTYCGGLGNGTYIDYTSSPADRNYSMYVDGDWSTATQLQSGRINSIYYIPYNATNSSVLQVKRGEAPMTENLSIPQSCWSTGILNLSTGIDVNLPVYKCVNNTGQLETFHTGGIVTYTFYEEAMWWNITLNSFPTAGSGKYGSLSSSLDVVQGDGNYSWSCLACDNSSNCAWASEGNYSLIIDTLKPAIDFSADTFSNGSYHSKSYVYVNVTVLDANLNFTNISIYNSTGGFLQSNRSTSYNLTGLSDGTYYFNATAQDLALNTNVTSTRTVYLDTVIAPPSFNYNESRYINRGNLYLNASCSDSNFQNLTINLYNSTLNNINATTSTTTPFAVNYTGLDNMIYYYNITCFDKALNSNSSITINTTIDTIKPYSWNDSVSSTSVTTGATVTIYTYANDSFSGVTGLTLSLVDANNASVSGSPFAMTLGNSSQWNYAYVTSPTGTFYVRNFTITDNAGNINTTTSGLSFIVNAASSSSGGGGGGDITIITKGTNETFTLLTETGGKEYIIYTIAGGVREKNIIIKNIGSKKQKYTYSCEGTICNILEVNGMDKTFELSVSETKTFTTQVTTPKIAKKGDTFTGKIFLKNDLGNEQYVSYIVTVQPLTGAFFKYLDVFRSKTDFTGKLGISAISPSAKPVFLPNIAVIALIEVLFIASMFVFSPKSTDLRNLVLINGIWISLLLSVVWLAV